QVRPTRRDSPGLQHWRVRARQTEVGRHTSGRGVPTENSVGSENTELPIIRENMVATTIRSLFVALFALVACSFRTDFATLNWPHPTETHIPCISFGLSRPPGR